MRRSTRQIRLQEEEEEELLINYDDDSDEDEMEFTSQSDDKEEESSMVEVLEDMQRSHSVHEETNKKLFVHGFHGLQNEMGTSTLLFELVDLLHIAKIGSTLSCNVHFMLEKFAMRIQICDLRKNKDSSFQDGIINYEIMSFMEKIFNNQEDIQEIENDLTNQCVVVMYILKSNK